MTADDVNPYILTAQERASWKDRIASLRSEGLFTPPSTVETLSIPGARGGSNWGTAASNPAKGMVYLTTQDWPTIYKLSLEDPFAPRTRAGKPGVPAGQSTYEQRCESCHGPNVAGSTVGPPRLAGINTRLDLESFQRVVLSGKGEMPAFQSLDDAALQQLFTYLVRNAKA
jgi:quinoprotein glucose dehydrogenase